MNSGYYPPPPSSSGGVEQFLIAGFVLVVGYFLYSSYNSTPLERVVDEKSNQPVVGKILRTSNDTRRRTDVRFAWRPAQSGQKIFRGDSIFTGEKSAANLQLSQGSNIDLGYNTMITFNDFEQSQANLQYGNFRISLNGDLKVILQGKIAVLSGRSSKIQIYIAKDSPPALQLLEGEATVHKVGETTPILLKKQTFVSLEQPPQAAPRPPPIPVKKHVPLPEPMKKPEQPAAPKQPDIVETKPEPEPEKQPEPKTEPETRKPAQEDEWWDKVDDVDKDDNVH